MNAYDFYFGEKQNAVLREHYDEITNMISSQSDKVVIKARGISYVDLPQRKENPDYLSEEEYKVLENGFSILYPTKDFVERVKDIIPSTIKELTIPVEFLEDITYLQRFPKLEKLTISTSGEVYPEEIEWISKNTKISEINLRNNKTIEGLIGNPSATIIVGGIGAALYNGIEINCLPGSEHKYSPTITIYSDSFENMEGIDKLFKKINGNISNITNIKFTKGTDYNSPGLQFYYHDDENLEKLVFENLTPTEVAEIYKRISQQKPVKQAELKTDNISHDDILKLKQINRETKFNIRYGESSHDATLQEFIAMRETIDYYKDLITAYNLSPVEKTAYVYDLLKSFRYQENMENKSDSRQIHSIVRDGKIVCVGYAVFAEQLLNELNIPTVCISATINNQDGTKSGHQRNILRVDDDKYNIHGMYAMDITWDSDRNISVINHNDKPLVVQHPPEEIQDKIIDRYDSLSLYRYFLIPMSEYELRFPSEMPQNFYEDYKNGGSKRLVSEARSIRDNGQKNTQVKNQLNLDRHRILFSDKEGAITVERYFDASKPSLETFKKIIHNVRRAEGYTQEETEYDIQRINELHQMINDQHPDKPNLFFRDEKTK